VSANESASALMREMWVQSSPKNRCPHVSYNGAKCCCSVVEESEAAFVCDTASLQLWCLSRERYRTCIFYPKA
jgi:hypothetical protein